MISIKLQDTDNGANQKYICRIVKPCVFRDRTRGTFNIEHPIAKDVLEKSDPISLAFAICNIYNENYIKCYDQMFMTHILMVDDVIQELKRIGKQFICID